MSSIHETLPRPASTSPFRRLWHRSLDHYPNTGPRIWYLAIVVIATIMLYYELYVPGAVAPSILQQYGMTFRFYVYAVGVVAAAVGAFASIIAGLADRWGRANMVTYGLLITALLVLYAVPNSPNKYVFVVTLSAVGFVEGIVLVATPALIRDLSPQMGRASAMGVWTLGPVIGSEVVSQVSSHTLAHLHAWQDQFTICGIAGLVVFAVALVGLRELSPGLRDQLMVSLRDRTLIEARAKGIDIKAALRNPWRQMVKADIVLPAFGVSVLLLVYYALVGFLVIYFATNFHWSQQQANALGNWFWAFDGLALVLVGVVSDWLKVRKPFMVIGAAGAIITTFFFLGRTTHPNTSYTTFVVIMSLLAVSLGVAYAPWFAAFTETVERRNPALTATGLAINGWIIRIVVTLSALALPIVVSSVTPLVQDGPTVAALAQKYAPDLATAAAVDPATLHTLTVDPTNATAGATAVGEIMAKFHVTSDEAIAKLTDLGADAKTPGFKLLQTEGPKIAADAKAAPSQWQHWWWVCIIGEILFIPLIFLMAGRWSPIAARRDAEEHQRKIEEEMSRLTGQTVS